MFVETVPVGVFQCNCGIVACEKTGKAVVVDPGDEPERILDIIRRHGFDVVVIAHTHAHIDHIMGTFEIVRSTGAKARLHTRERRLWDRLDIVAESLGIPTPPRPMLSESFVDGETIQFGDGRMRVLYTPGHTPGSCAFAFADGADGEVVFSGDTLFRGAIGNLDIQRQLRISRANADTIITSIRARLLTLDDDTRVVPGHGPETHIGFERRHNPFLLPQSA